MKRFKPLIAILITLTSTPFLVIFYISMYKLSIHLISLETFGTQEYIGTILVCFLTLRFLGRARQIHFSRDEA
jgi:hypothetical protein